MQEIENGLIRLKMQCTVTLTSNDIFQLQFVESCFAIDATPVKLFAKGVGNTVPHNPPNAILNINSSNEAQCSNLKKII